VIAFDLFIPTINVISFEIDTSHQLQPGNTCCSWGFNYESLIGTGVLTEVQAEHEKMAALDQIMFHYGFTGETSYETVTLNKTKILKLEVLEMTGKRHS
jgi:uncharacterized protein